MDANQIHLTIEITIKLSDETLNERFTVKNVRYLQWYLDLDKKNPSGAP